MISIPDGKTVKELPDEARLGLTVRSHGAHQQRGGEEKGEEG